ncbi:FAD-dependent oxidoreductase [Candidatus Parcubacteria bacterium]|nr:FAD-dependent oxidoreductase [Candidatus Parcubacteria bacterium]
MKSIKTETLIIGAGPAGMATAMELLKAGKDFLLVEKDSQVGGLSKTYIFKEKDGLVFRADNGPHRFYSKNQYLYNFIEELIDEDWITVERHSRQLIKGKYYDYPINAPQALRNIGFFRASIMGVQYVWARIKYSIFKRPVRNFKDYVYKHFGKGLGEFNMIHYAEKIWGIPSEDLHEDFAGQRIKGLSITSLLKDAVTKALGINFKNKPKTLIDTFFYPSKGTGLIYDTIARRVEESGHQILLNSYPVKILHSGNHINKVIIQTPEGEAEVVFKYLVESIPLTEFVHLVEPPLSKEVLDANDKLKHRSQVFLFITLNKESITRDQWIYIPDKDIPFARISEMRNFSQEMSPKGKTSIFVEFFCSEDDAIWNMNKEELTKLSLPYFDKLGFFKPSEVREVYHIRNLNNYPLYDINYKTYLDKVKMALDKFDNLFYIGRPGRFRYNNQDHSLEMGMLAAKSIIDGKKYDIEEVGNEKEYFEKGNLKHS